MFVEGDVEIKVKDRSTVGFDDHNMKLWLQRSFKDLSCYRIDKFKMDAERIVHATVALKLSVLPDSERHLIETHPNDVGLLRSFVEKMFDGKGNCRCVGQPKLRNN